MSTKKDNFQLSDKKLMKLAISLAENHKYFTGTNPSVGCVITRNNKIIKVNAGASKRKIFVRSDIL